LAPWDREALDEAARLDRPIFLSVGYAACHWCHVMAHESFEDPKVASILNQYFIPIKVDREERPDVDALYMAATQLVSGHGGWPMSVFLRPTGRPFMAGTYYPPVERHGQVSFTTLLTAMHDVWSTRRDEVERQADELTRAIEREVSSSITSRPSPTRSTSRRRDSVYATSWSSASTMKAHSATRRNFRDRATSRRCSSSTTTRRASRSNGPWTRCRDEGSTTISEGASLDTASTPSGTCRTLKRCSATRHCWRGPTSAPPGPCPSTPSARGRPGHDQLRAQRPRRGKWFASALDADAGGLEGSHVTWTPKEVADALEEDGLHDDLDAVRQRWRIEEAG